MHLACGVADREIQLGEVVIVGLDIGAFGDRKSHVGENRREFVPDLAQRVDAAGFDRRLAQRQRDVDGLFRQTRVKRGRLQHIAALSQRLCDLVLGEIDGRALRLALVRRHFAEGCEQDRDRTFLAEGCDADGFERSFIAGSGDFAQDFLFKRWEVGHGLILLQRAGWLWLPKGRNVKQKALKSALPVDRL